MGTQTDIDERNASARRVTDSAIEALANSSPTGLLLATDGVVTWANPAAHRLLGMDDRALIGSDLADVRIVHLLDGIGLSTMPRTLHAVLDGEPIAAGVLLERADHRQIAVRLESTSCTDEDRVVTNLTITGADDVLEGRRRLQSSRSLFGALATRAPVAVAVSDLGMRIAFANERMAGIWGRTSDELLGTSWMDDIDDDDLPGLRRAVNRVLAGEETSVPIRVRRPCGDVRQLECRFAPVEREDHSVGFVATAEDLTDLHRQKEELAWQARHDPLTSLANRQALEEHCQELLDAGAPFALVFLDLDDFKVVNDGMGHGAGDQLLQIVAQRLGNVCRREDLISRVGGDEFVVAVEGVVSGGAASRIAESILEALSDPARIEGRPVQISASVGVVTVDDTDETPSDFKALLRDADVAMYQAKREGKGRVATFRTEARHEFERHLHILEDLRSCLERREIGVAFQPIVDADTLEVVSAEALLRYRHPALGVVPPPTVVALTEEMGLQDALGQTVLHVAIAQMRRWIDEGSPIRSVSANISARHLVAPTFADDVLDALADHGVEPTALTIELTETQVMTDVDQAVGALERLAAAGIKIAIDDFGTGHSSLAYLARLPFHVVKVDREFVRELPGSARASAIIRVLVILAQGLGAEVIVEGVETEAQLDVVRKLGCPLAQGYLLGRPGAADDVVPAVPEAS